MDANFLTHKMGPFPLWAWVGIAVAGLLVFEGYKTKTGNVANTGSSGLAGTSAANLPNGTAFDPQDLTVVQEGYNPPAITVNNTGGVPSVQGRDPYVAYVHSPFDNTIYGVDKGGTRTSLTWNQYQALGDPAFSDIKQSVFPASGGTASVPRPAPAAPAPAAPQSRSVTVAPWTAGNTPWNSTLWGIAQHYYNDGSQYTKLAQANGIANPNLIYPGQVIKIP